ncbi:hypothetical protein IVB34_12620 [Bradyrhizobium sp. 2]|uniref:hypothetical protein n=1 Tax=Bradyrhizobium sp. 2 TaxID=190045 RepID=UPI001FFB3199|nr:hypothetical protein [Bradyrhizobium sp. 2]MCK1459199.1 hypothetical protein [Bradyrhizobium sp. 2]
MIPENRNKKLGRLTIISVKTEGRRRIADCICECGARKFIRADHVISGLQASCGCQKGGVTIHGMHNTSTYTTWQQMRERCANPNNKSFNRYGGRGVIVCPRWELFENFIEDMGERPPGKSLDRINNDGNYDPSNCRWASISEQANNKRNTVLVQFQGQQMPLSDAIAASGSVVPSNTIRMRLKSGWDLSRALSETARPYRKDTIENALCCIGFGLCVFASLAWGLV